MQKSAQVNIELFNNNLLLVILPSICILYYYGDYTDITTMRTSCSYVYVVQACVVAVVRI